MSSLKTRLIVPLMLALSAPACADDGGGGSGGESSTSAGPGSSDGNPSSTTASSTTASSTTASPTGGSGDTADTTVADDTGGASSSSSEGGSSSESTGGGSSTGATACGVILVEAVMDVEGGDDMLQWVQLYNSCDEAIDLSSWTIGYGGPDYGPPRVKGLQGEIAAGGCYTVGGPTSSAANGMPDFEYSDDFAPGLIVAAKVGAGVALFDIPAAMVDAASVPVDAVVYGPNNDDGLIDESGTPVAAPHTGSPVPGGSIQRTSLDATWESAATPTPGDCPGF